MIGSLALLLMCRALVRKFLFFIRTNEMNTRTAAIFGATESGHRLYRQLAGNRQFGIRFLGFYDDRDPERTFKKDENISGNYNDGIELAKSGEIDYVYIALPFYAKNRTDDLLAMLADTTATVHIIPNLYEYQLLHAQWNQIGEVTTLSVFDTPYQGVDGLLKRCFDILFSIIFIMVFSLPMLIIALLIKLTSEGPVFFAQNRYGLDGKKIKVLKFRTMKTMDNGDVVNQATVNDDRITPIGHFLRSSSLDEIPQFFNVLMGSMSIVGPRPHAVAHNEEYRALINRYMLRHKVKPGITGWAQVNGWRGETQTIDKMESRIKYDLEYINNWSLILDFKIILKTVSRNVLFSKNAY